MENTHNLQTFEHPDVDDFKPPKCLFYINERGAQLFPFHPNNVIINQAKQNNSGRGKSAPLEYKLELDGKTLVVPLRLQTPRMNVIFGYNEKTVGADGKVPTPNIGLSFRAKDSVPEIRAFYQAMWLLDERIRAEAHRCYKSWFINKWRDLEKSPTTIDVNHYALTRIGTDANGHQYPPSFNVKCKKLYNAYTYQVFGPSCGSCGTCTGKASLPKNPDCLVQQSPHDIIRGSSAVAVVEMKQIWVTDKYGISCDLLQCQLFKNPFSSACTIVPTASNELSEEDESNEMMPPIIDMPAQAAEIMYPPAQASASNSNSNNPFKRRMSQESEFAPPAKKQEVEKAGGFDTILTGMIQAARDL
jgi:hypothetical protein